MADAFTGPFDGYVLWLKTEGRPKSPATIRNYCYYLREMRSYALQRGLTSWEQITRAHVRAFLAERRQKVSSSSAAVAHYALKSFFRYLETEELEGTGYRSPMTSARAPEAPQAPVVPVLTSEHLRWLTEGAKKGGALDEALVWLLMDTGIRIGEVAEMKITDLEMSQAPRLLVHGAVSGDQPVTQAAVKSPLSGEAFAGASADPEIRSQTR